MIVIRITLDNGSEYFINEDRKGIVLVNDIKDAFRYQTTLEFKVTWKLNHIIVPNYLVDGYSILKENVSKFEYIDEYSYIVKVFDINKIEIEIDKEIYVDSITFRRLIKSPLSSVHWCYDKNDEWIISEENDYKKITKIRYINKGLLDTITSYNNWNDRYDEHSWHGCYELHHKCMQNPIIQQICLLDLSDYHEFIILENKHN